MDLFNVTVCFVVFRILTIKKHDSTKIFPMWFLSGWFLLSSLFFGAILLSNNDQVWFQTQNKFGKNVTLPILPQSLSNDYKQIQEWEDIKTKGNGCDLTFDNFIQEAFYGVSSDQESNSETSAGFFATITNKLGAIAKFGHSQGQGNYASEGLSFMNAHLLQGFFVHYFFGSNIYVSFYISAIWEGLENYLFPYWGGTNECWFDQLFLDILGCNLIGIVLSHLWIKTFVNENRCYYDYKVLQTLNDFVTLNCRSKHSKKTLILIVAIFSELAFEFFCGFSWFFMGGWTISNGYVKLEHAAMFVYFAHFLDYFMNENNGKNKKHVWIMITCFMVNLIVRIICMYYHGTFSHVVVERTISNNIFITAVSIKIILASWCSFVLYSNSKHTGIQKIISLFSHSDDSIQKKEL